MTRDSQKRADADYLDRLERALSGLEAAARREFVEEIRSHIAEACGGSEEPEALAKVLRELGPPEDLAAERLSAEGEEPAPNLPASRGAGGARGGLFRVPGWRSAALFFGIFALAVCAAAGVFAVVNPPRVNAVRFEAPHGGGTEPVSVGELPAVILVEASGARRVTAWLEGPALSSPPSPVTLPLGAAARGQDGLYRVVWRRLPPQPMRGWLVVKAWGWGPWADVRKVSVQVEGGGPLRLPFPEGEVGSTWEIAPNVTLVERRQSGRSAFYLDRAGEAEPLVVLGFGDCAAVESVTPGGVFFLARGSGDNPAVEFPYKLALNPATGEITRSAYYVPVTKPMAFGFDGPGSWRLLSLEQAPGGIALALEAVGSPTVLPPWIESSYSGGDLVIAFHRTTADPAHLPGLPPGVELAGVPGNLPPVSGGGGEAGEPVLLVKLRAPADATFTVERTGIHSWLVRFGAP